MQEFTCIYNDVITSDISDSAYRLYSLLCSYCYGDKDICFPSQKTLANALNRSVRSIQRYLKELVINKLIKITRRGSISNLYTILNKVVLQKMKSVAKGIKTACNGFKNKQSNFTNYKQRNYDFKSLEDKLLGWEKQYE